MIGSREKRLTKRVVGLTNGQGLFIRSGFQSWRVQNQRVPLMVRMKERMKHPRHWTRKYVQIIKTMRIGYSIKMSMHGDRRTYKTCGSKIAAGDQSC